MRGPAVVFDLLARVLRRRYDLTFARNFTDVDDKINAASVETGKPIDEITEKYMTAYNEDMGCSWCVAARCRATCDDATSTR